MKINKIDNEIKTETSHVSDIPQAFDLPEVSTQSEAYHDDEEISINEESLGDSVDAESSPENGTENSAESVHSAESPIYMENEREKSRGIKDEKGKPFDPSMHNFPPEKTASGIWKKLPKSKREKVDPENGKTILPADTNIKCLRDAEKSARFYDTAHVMLFGAEAKGDKNQISALTESFEKFYQENGAVEIPAHWELAITCLDHTTEIIKRPTIFERVQLGAIKLYMKIKGKKQGEKDEEKTGDE